MSEFYIPKDVDVLKIDLSEHDAKIRADAYTEGRQDTLEEVLDGIGYADSVKECMEFVEELLEKMKEQNNVY